MTIRNTAPLDEEPVFELVAETPVDSKNLQHIFIRNNQRIQKFERIEFLQVTSESFMFGNTDIGTIKSVRLGFILPQQKMSIRGKLSLALKILLS